MIRHISFKNLDGTYGTINKEFKTEAEFANYLSELEDDNIKVTGIL